jgi:enediyne biosynthesis protein E4
VNCRSVGHGWVLLLPIVSCLFFGGCVRRDEVSKTTSTPKSLPSNSIESNGETESLSPDTIALFHEVTDQTGIDFQYSSGRSAGEFAIIESLGGGVGAFDFDGDRLVDLMFAGGGRLDNKSVTPLPCAVFRNLGDFRFIRATAQSGLAADANYNHGIFPADFDNDGFADVSVSGYGGVQLFRNQGDGTFVLWKEIKTHATNPWSTGIAWADFDCNGILDMYVAHYVDWSFENHPTCSGDGAPREVCGPKDFKGIEDVILFGDGDGGFEQQSSSVGIVGNGKGLGVVAGDVDSDGDVDIYVANDTTDNFLYMNDGSGKFEETATIAGVSGDEYGVSTGSMGVVLEELTGDDLLDLWVTNFERELYALYRNEGSGLFTHVSRNAGLAAINGLFVGFGTVAVDIDQDGDSDLVVANGHVSYFAKNAPFKQSALLLRNDGGGKFSRLREQGYFSELHSGRGLAKADLNQDGILDLVFTHLEEPISILKGLGSSGPKPLKLHLVGTQSNRDSLGATIIAETEFGKASAIVSGGGSYLSSSDYGVQLSLKGSVYSVIVRWPSGEEERFKVLSQDNEIRLVEGSSDAIK